MSTDTHADTAPRGPRAAGRELALLALCHLEGHGAAEISDARALLWSHPPIGEGPDEDAFARLLRDKEARDFADVLVDAWDMRRAEVDALLQQTSARWRLDRMDRIDRNAMRLATTELLAGIGTPRGVVLSEAVRLARRYGSDKSAGFVNGVLDAVAKRLADITTAEET